MHTRRLLLNTIRKQPLEYREIDGMINIKLNFSEMYGTESGLFDGGLQRC
jgi:hypothetical protein